MSWLFTFSWLCFVRFTNASPSSSSSNSTYSRHVASNWLNYAYGVLVVSVFANEADAAGGRGGAITRGGGGASGVRLRHQEGDETGTLNVILVVILPVAQMIVVLIIISLIRICYVHYRYGRHPPEPKLLQVVASVQEQQQQNEKQQNQRFQESLPAIDKPSINNLKF